MGRERSKKRGEEEEEEEEEEEDVRRKRKHSHRRHHRREDEESESSEDSAESSSESEEESSSSSEEEEEEEEERRKRKKKMKRRRKSSEGSSKHKSKSKKAHKRHKASKKKKKLKNYEEISIEDYFKKSVEFRNWLSEERKIFFSDLSSQDSRNLFKEFVKEWNDQLLNKKYYRGLQSASLEHKKQTGHVWKFSRSLSKNELSGVMESVSSWTSGDGAELGGKNDGGERSSIGPRLSHEAPPTGGGGGGGSGSRVKGPTMGPFIGPQVPGSSGVATVMDSDPHMREERWRDEREKVKRERKEMRKQHETVMDELLPKATGREARFEKKKIRAEKRRDREVSPDVADSTLMGPSANIRDKIQRREEHRQNRAHAAADKVAAIQAREKSKMQALLEMAKANKKEGALW